MTTLRAACAAVLVAAAWLGPVRAGDVEQTSVANLTFEPIDGKPLAGTAKRPDGAGYALRGDRGYSIHATRRMGKAMGPTTLVLEMTAWGSGGATLGVRAQCYDARRKRVGACGTGLWHREITGRPTRVTTRFTLPGDQVDSVRLLFYRSNQKGVVWVDDVRVQAMRLHAAGDLVAELSDRLHKDGWRTAVQGSHLVASRPGRRDYFRTFGDKRLTRHTFDATSHVGTTCVSRESCPKRFPIGTYFYGGKDQLTAIATSRGMTFPQYMDAQMADMAAHGCNAVYLSNLTITPDAFRTAVAAARKHGLVVFAQLTRDLYLRPTKGPEHYAKVTVPTATRIMPGYRDLPGVVAWMPKEEASPDQVPMLRTYRNLIRKLDPTHGIYTLHNSVRTFRCDNADLPEWFGFDRYRFRSLFGHYGILLSTPKDAARLLRKDLADFQQEAALRNRPIVYVGQAGGWDWRGPKEELLKLTHGVVPGPHSGWNEIEPGTWYGWMRYPPPRYGMRLQFWLSVLEGYKGVLFFAHKGRLRKGIQSFGMTDLDGKGTPRWKETAQTARELKPLVPLILQWHKEAIAPAETDHPEAWVRSFIRSFDSERYLVVVNARIAHWDKDSPARPGADTELRFTPQGLAGLHPSEPLTCQLTVHSTLDLFDVRTGQKVAASRSAPEARTYRITVAPGGGRVFVLGDPSWTKAHLSGCAVNVD